MTIRLARPTPRAREQPDKSRDLGFQLRGARLRDRRVGAINGGPRLAAELEASTESVFRFGRRSLGRRDASPSRAARGGA